MSLPLTSDDAMSIDKPETSQINPGKVPDPNLPLQVVFLLDITGSMGSQIEGVKSMIATFCSYDRPGVNVHVWTFTEDTTTCYVCKSPLGLNEDDLVDYVFQIKLCCPPEFPNANAGGGDGPENVVAGVTSLIHSFDSRYNIICFIITDDSPHHAAFGNSGEAKAEKKWLTEHGHNNHDIFFLLNEVIDSLNVTFVPVLYGSSMNMRWYQQAAVMTQGCILCPNSTNSEVLANGLGSILTSFQKVSLSKTVSYNDIGSFDKVCEGFSVIGINPDEFQPLDTDPKGRDELSSVAKHLRDPEEIKSSLLGLMETACDRFTGKKAGKRCRTVDTKVVSASVRTMTMSMLHLINSPLFNEERFNKEVDELFKLIEESKSETAEYEKKQLTRLIESLPERKAILSEPLANPDKNIQPVECLITLESALEYLNTLEAIPKTEDEVSAWMEIVLKLTLCRFISISFPLDADKLPDFKDAWSASLRNVELQTILSTSSAVKLRDPETCTFVDPLSGKRNNAAVIIAHPNDEVLSQTYACLSSFPSLQGLVQSYLVSGGLKVFPSIVPGIQSSTLLYLIRGISKSNNFSQAEWEFVRCIIWSLQITTDIPAIQVVNSLKSGNGLNSVDNISKILAGIITYVYQKKSIMSEDENILELLYKELSADTVAKINKFRQSDNVDLTNGMLTDDQINRCFVSKDDIESFNPCLELHFSEKLNKKLIPLPEQGIQTVKEFVSASNTFGDSVALFTIICNLLECDPKITDVNLALSSIPKQFLSTLSNEKMIDIFTESLLIKTRTARYVLDDQSKWQRPAKGTNPINLEDICIESISKELRPKFTE